MAALEPNDRESLAQLIDPRAWEKSDHGASLRYRDSREVQAKCRAKADEIIAAGWNRRTPDPAPVVAEGVRERVARYREMFPSTPNGCILIRLDEAEALLSPTFDARQPVEGLSEKTLRALEKAAERFHGAYLDNNHPWRLLTDDYCAVLETCAQYPQGAWLDGIPDDLALAFLALTNLKPLLAAIRLAPAPDPAPVSAEGVREAVADRITPAWCSAMSELEVGHEVGAGLMAMDAPSPAPEARQPAEGLSQDEEHGTARHPIGSPGWSSMMQVRLMAARTRPSPVAAVETGGALRERAERAEAGVDLAIKFAAQLKSAPRLSGPVCTHHDAKLNRLWGKWLYDEGKTLWDQLKPWREARLAALAPKADDAGGEG